MRKLTILLIGFAITLVVAGCGSAADTEENNASTAEAKVLHVATTGDDQSADGSEEAPYGSIEAAIASKIGPGSEIIVHEGTYGPVEIGSDASGSSDATNVIWAAKGEKVVIATDKGSLQSGEAGMKQQPAVRMTNVSNIKFAGFEIQGGTHGILYESTVANGDDSIENVTIEKCSVHDVVGAHGIAVYAGNDLAAVKHLTVCDCEVYDCLCGDSESLVLNGNIDGFEVYDNVIHDNNNIGIDMIGFEGTARHKKGGDFDNLYDVDFARNGLCHDNVVYNISAEGNPAYLEDGDYDLCADGIYVDGGQNIEIYNNFVFNCDIGLEVATEHSPDDNELFRVEGIKVHDNVTAGCKGWCGLCFGGYDKNLGFTEGCQFINNTFVDNGTQLRIQRSRDNELHGNLFVGGDDSSAIEFNTDCSQNDMVNYFGKNTWCIGQGSLQDYIESGDYDIDVMIPGGLTDQKSMHNRSKVLNGFRSLIDGVGSEFVPDESYVNIYNNNREAE